METAILDLYYSTYTWHFWKIEEISLRDDRKLAHRPKVATLSSFYVGEQLLIIET